MNRLTVPVVPEFCVMDCPHHEHVDRVLARLETHCNGDHVRPQQVADLRKDVDIVAQNVDKVCERLARLMHDVEVEKARRDSSVKLLVALVTAIGVLAQALIAHYLR